jgi:hypothetical protein
MALVKDDAIAYPPLDIPKPVADDVWVVDGGPLRVMGLVPVPIRMTVLRLAGGDLLLHSPTRFLPALRRSLQALGPIGHLVAPSMAHWTHVKEWQDAIPQAVCWAAPGLRQRRQVRRSGMRFDHDLGDIAPRQWADEIEQIVVRGIGGYSEVAMFHRPSRTLLLCDLVQNLESGKLPPLARIFAGLSGNTAPQGRAPAYLRTIVRLQGAASRHAARRLVALRPDRVIFAHGSWFESDGPERLERSLAWLL